MGDEIGRKRKGNLLANCRHPTFFLSDSRLPVAYLSRNCRFISLSFFMLIFGKSRVLGISFFLFLAAAIVQYYFARVTEMSKLEFSLRFSLHVSDFLLILLSRSVISRIIPAKMGRKKIQITKISDERNRQVSKKLMISYIPKM